MAQFFEAVMSEATSRENDTLPDVETYMVLRRGNSGCQPCFDLLEYALGIDLPDFVVSDPVLQILSQCANDFIALSNVSPNFFSSSRLPLIPVLGHILLQRRAFPRRHIQRRRHNYENLRPRPSRRYRPRRRDVPCNAREIL
jgi:hypothetical protein